jgi:hypothetical protein
MSEFPEKYRFTAVIEKHPDLDASYLTVPLNVPEIFGTKGQVKVKIWVEGYEFRGLLSPMGGACHLLGIRKEIRTAIGKTFGDLVDVTLERDLEPRTVSLPPDLEEFLNQNPTAKAAFDKLSFTHRNEHVKALEEAKKPETRQRRLQKIIEKLLK